MFEIVNLATKQVSDAIRNFEERLVENLVPDYFQASLDASRSGKFNTPEGTLRLTRKMEQRAHEDVLAGRGCYERIGPVWRETGRGEPLDVATDCCSKLFNPENLPHQSSPLFPHCAADVYTRMTAITGRWPELRQSSRITFSLRQQEEVFYETLLASQSVDKPGLERRHAGFLSMLERNGVISDLPPIPLSTKIAESARDNWHLLCFWASITDDPIRIRK